MSGQVVSEVALSFPAQLGLVPAVRTFVSRIIRQKGYSARDCFRTETIVDEICNNAVQHGLQRDGANVTLRVSVGLDRLSIDALNESQSAGTEQLRDHIAGLQEKVVVHSKDKRGRGLALVRMLASELTADISDTGTTIHVTKLKEG